MDGLKKVKAFKRIKCAPRGAKELERKLRALAARIPDQEALDIFLAACPAEQRAAVAAKVVPYVRF